MISNEGQIVCIPKEKDSPTIGIIGARRTGKSLILHGFVDRIYHYFGENCIVMNDYMNESLTWRKPQKTEKFINKLEIVGEKPLPLPVVHLYPNSVDFIKPEKKGTKYLKIALSYEDFVEHLGDFYELGRAEPYYIEMKKELLQIKEDYEKNIIELMNEKVHKKMSLMKKKLITLLLSMIHDKFVDTGEQDVVSKIKIVRDDGTSEEYNPFIALMAAKLVPVLMTNQIYSKDRFFPAYFSRIMTEIFYDQIREGGYSYKNRSVTHIFVDELHTLVSKKRSSPAEDILNKAVAQSGPARLGFYYCDQNYSKIPKIMRDNTKYIIALGHNSKEEAELIVNNFNMPKSRIGEILSLDKQKQECIAATSERFLVYDISQNKKWYETGSIAGTFLPPLSHSIPPIMF